jgi:hypothetical protein
MPIKNNKLTINKPKELLIFNKRAGKISKHKLSYQFQEFINLFKQKIKY